MLLLRLLEKNVCRKNDFLVFLIDWHETSRGKQLAWIVWQHLPIYLAFTQNSVFFVRYFLGIYPSLWQNLPESFPPREKCKTTIEFNFYIFSLKLQFFIIQYRIFGCQKTKTNKKNTTKANSKRFYFSDQQ